MLGDKIRELRTQHNITQKELAEQLFVTAQAVSRWEKNEVEPSIKTLTEIAKIFDVSIDKLLEEEGSQPTVDDVVEDQTEQVEEQAEQQPGVEKEEKVVLAVCEQCNKPIYSGDDIVRVREHNDKVILCKDCHQKTQKTMHDNAVRYGVTQRQKSFGWGITAGVVAVIVALCVTLSLNCSWQIVLASCLGACLVYPLVACLLLKNNFIGEMVVEVASWGFVTFPGLIFSLDLDGILWLLTVKLLFWILGFILATGALLLAIALGLVVSLFVYPFALAKSYKHPEESED